MTITEISDYRQEEFESLCRLLRQLSPGCILPDERRYRSMLGTAGSHLFLLKDGDTTAGMLSVGTYDIPTGRRAWIEDVAVDEAYRGRGYGRALVRHAVEFARSQRADTLMLTSNPGRVAANALYRSEGFASKQTNVYVMKFGVEEKA